jgi:hypothetical protein
MIATVFWSVKRRGRAERRRNERLVSYKDVWRFEEMKSLLVFVAVKRQSSHARCRARQKRSQEIDRSGAPLSRLIPKSGSGVI